MNKRIVRVLLIAILWQAVMFSVVQIAAGSIGYRYVWGEQQTGNYGVCGYQKVYDPTIEHIFSEHVVESLWVYRDDSNWIEVGWVKGVALIYVKRFPTFFIRWANRGEPGLEFGSHPYLGSYHFLYIKDLTNPYPTLNWKVYIDDGTQKTLNDMSFYNGIACGAQSETAEELPWSNDFDGHHYDLCKGVFIMSHFVFIDWTNTYWDADSPYYFKGHNDTWFKSGGPQ